MTVLNNTDSWVSAKELVDLTGFSLTTICKSVKSLVHSRKIEDDSVNKARSRPRYFRSIKAIS